MSSSPCSPTSTFNIFSLPPELIEQTLVLLATCGFPSAIASLSQTCKYLHNLVWQATDQHLWREIFLTTFDDPRPIMNHLRRENPGELEHHNGTVSFNWAEEYMQRMSAAKYIRRWTNPTPKSRSEVASQSPTPAQSFPHTVTESETPGLLLRSLKSLLSVISTSLPFPSSPRITDFTHVAPPTFPAIVLLHSSPLPFPSSFQSRNAAWIEETLSKGYPPVLARRLFTLLTGRHARVANEIVTKEIEEGEFEKVKYAEWEDTEEGRLFSKLVFLKGFIPIPEDEQEDSAVSTLLHRDNHEVASGGPGSDTPSTPHSDVTIPPSSIHAESPHTPVKYADQQVAAARASARNRVYNLRYSTRERCWGPFLPLAQVSQGDKKDSAGPRIQIRRPSGVQVGGISVRQNNGEGLAGDSSQALGAVGGTSQSSVTVSSQDQTVEIGQDEDDSGDYNPGDGDDGDDDDPDILDLLPLMDTNGIDFSDDEIHETFVFPSPHRLVPDYAFLASARLIIEANLREMLLEHPAHEDAGAIGTSSSKVIDAFACLELLRMGGAPEFWTRSWLGGKREEDNEDGQKVAIKGEEEITGDKGKGKARDVDGEVEGWDWAGVTGEWRRTVCWLDYRDLLLHNLGSFDLNDNELQETLRIFPMTLRVAGYSRVAPPSPSDPSPTDMDSLIWKLPIIHVQGESRGSDIDEESVRHVSGTVRMIGDGAVRWSLTSSQPDSEDPEWVTEGVQIGSIGSAIGILGMWTGAEHVRTDPLGEALLASI